MNWKVFYWIISACTLPTHPCPHKEHNQLSMMFMLQEGRPWFVTLNGQTICQKFETEVMQELKSSSTIILRNLMEALGCRTYPYLSRLLNSAWSKQMMYWKNHISCWNQTKNQLDNQNSLPAWSMTSESSIM